MEKLTKTNNIDAGEFINEWFAQFDKQKRKVSSQEYIDWIYDYVSANKHADDEAALYHYEGIDSENGQLLGVFLDYAKELSAQQGVLVASDYNCDFDNEQITVKIKDKYFELFRMFGQGSYTSVGLLEEKPEYMYVDCHPFSDVKDDVKPEIKEKIMEHVKKLAKEGGTDSDVIEFCEENHICMGLYDKMQADYIFAGTSCEGCPNNVMNVGAAMYPCNYCSDNCKFANYKSYKGIKVEKNNTREGD